MAAIESQIHACCSTVAGRLAAKELRVVFAESCTAGLISASLAAVPGISAWLCGSQVTYREATKSQWLGVTSGQLERHTAVSEVVASQMVVGALNSTPEADLALSITGHFGPNAPPHQDGVVFIGIAHRSPATGLVGKARVQRLELSADDRSSRRLEATLKALNLLAAELQGDL